MRFHFCEFVKVANDCTVDHDGFDRNKHLNLDLPNTIKPLGLILRT